MKTKRKIPGHKKLIISHFKIKIKSLKGKLFNIRETKTISLNPKNRKTAETQKQI